MAYEVEEEDWPAVLEALDIRERHGYTRRVGVWVCDSPITKKLIVTFCFDWVESLVCCFFWFLDALTWRLVGDLH